MNEGTSPLKERRTQAELTIAALAKVSGVSGNLISEFERGARRPWPSAMRKLAEALGVDVRELFPDEVERRQRELATGLGLGGQPT